MARRLDELAAELLHLLDAPLEHMRGHLGQHEVDGAEALLRLLGVLTRLLETLLQMIERGGRVIVKSELRLDFNGHAPSLADEKPGSHRGH